MFNNINATLVENYNNYIFSNGLYFLRVSPSTSLYKPDTSYTLTVKEVQEPVRVNITQIESDGGVQGYIDYGYGRFWRIKSDIVIHGQLLDAYGETVPNAPVELYIQGDLNNILYSGVGTTDVNGYFSVQINNIGPAIGNYSYYTGRNVHLYDIIPIVAFSNGVQMISNEQFLYHFAYSYYVR